MTPQTPGQRASNWQKWMRKKEWPSSMLKANLRAAYNAADDWWESAKNGAAPTSSFNSALPQPFRRDATRRQKDFLLITVISDRRRQGND